MAKFYPINPNTLYPQNIDLEDASVISSDEITGLFNPELDVVEYFIYDFNDTLLNSFYNYRNWTNTGDPSLASTTPSPPSAVSASSVVSVPTVPTSQISTVNIDPVSDATNIGYTFGKVKSVYNFISPKLGTSFFNKLFISEISSDRTEIRLSSNFILNDSLEISYDIFKQELDSTSYYDDFYLNFGDNQYVLSVNILLDKTSPKYSLLIKLYNPLPSNFNLKNEAYIVVKQANSLAYAVELDSNITLPDNSIPLKTANLNISVLDNINNSTDYKNLDNLLTTTSSGSFYQLLNYLSGSNINLTTDYTDYENFVFFSSADQRLSNFRQKLLIISSSQSELVGINNITGSTSSSLAISSSKAIIESSIYTTITNFDNYERYLYYDSSSYTWPKVNNTQPYTLYDVNSVTGNNWYTSQSVTASNYDQNNQNSLYYIIPQFIRYDSNNTQYLLFVDMIGQLFDEVWLYTQNITDKLDSNSNLNVGVSPDLVHDVLTSLGVKLYGSNFTNQNLYNSLIGLNPSGGLLLPTGSFLINNYVTSSISASLVPTLDDFHKLTYKKIYHALPYLVKSKGTLNNVQALLNIFGVPNTVLRINEFGGKDKNFNTFDNWEEEFSYAFNTSASAKVSTPWTASSAPYGTIYPNALEFKFKTSGLPTSSIAYSQSIVNHSTNHFNVVLEYTGSGYNTSSYSGSIKDPNYQYATLKFITGSLSASVYLPFYDGGWWSVLVNATTGSTTSYNLYAKNSIYSGSDGNILGYQASASFTGSKFWSSSGQLYFGTGSVTNAKTYTPFSGSYQEIRYYNIPLSESAFNAFVMNPNSIEGNNAEGTQSSKNSLFYRIPLGGELYTGSTSAHPGITGSSPVSQSFTGASSTASYSGSYNFVNNYQYIFFDQFAVGIQNAVSQKIKTQNIILPYTSSLGNIPTNTVLSPYISIQQNLPISSSYTADVNYVETALSPQNEINEDINSTLGYLNIGDYIGDPRLVSSSAQSYPALDILRDLYFEKYSSNYNWSEFVSLIEQYDSSLFKMIQDFIPARDGLASGLVIKQTLLERNKYPVPQLNTFTTTSYQYLDQPFVSQNTIITGSANSLQVWDYLNSTPVFITSSLVHINGGNGGSMPDLFGQTQSVGYFSGITQSWTGSTPSNSGSVFFTQSNQSEFYNGQLSGSTIIAATQSLDNYTININQVYSTGTIYFNTTTTSDQSMTSSYINFDFNYDQYYYVSFTAKRWGSPSTPTQLYFYNQDGSIISSSIIPANNLGGNTGSVTVNQLQIRGLIPKDRFYIFTGLGSFGYSASIENFTVSQEQISNPEYLAIQNNAIISRPNPYYMEVDFQTSAVVAVNEQAILSGSATRAQVPQSNYTTTRITNPRYNGCKNTSPAINVISGSTPATINIFGDYALRYDDGGFQDNILQGGFPYLNLKYMFDANGNVLQPKQSSSYEYNGISLFSGVTSSNIIIQSTASVPPQIVSSLQGFKPVSSIFTTINLNAGTVSGSLNTFSSSTGSIRLYSPSQTKLPVLNVTNVSWTTGSLSPSIITSSQSNIGNYFYRNQTLSEGWIQVDCSSSTNITNPTGSGDDRAGFNSAQTALSAKPGSIFYFGSGSATTSSIAHTIISSSYDTPFTNYFIYLDKPVLNCNLSQFAIVDTLTDMTKITINTDLPSTGSFGKGFVLPQLFGVQNINNLNQAIEILATKGLV
jgi:hypothetical protein